MNRDSYYSRQYLMLCFKHCKGVCITLVSNMSRDIGTSWAVVNVVVYTLWICQKIVTVNMWTY